MKNLLSAAALLLLTCTAQAQSDAENNKSVSRAAGCSKVYIDLGSGLNNNQGLLGVGVDVHVADQVSLNAGVGLLTTWGYKFYFGGKYFFKPCHNSWAIGAGATYSTGLSGFHTNIETVYGTKEDVGVDLLSQTNVFVAGYKYWNLGRRSNRFYITAGFSIPTSSDKFHQFYGAPVSSNGATALKLLSPGGLIAGFGFSFGTGRRS